MHIAVEQDQVPIVRLLLDRGADIHAETNFDHLTPLHMAVQERHGSIVQLLIERGANLNVPTKRSKHTPLHLAAIKGYRRGVILLVDSGASKTIWNVRECGTSMKVYCNNHLLGPMGGMGLLTFGLQSKCKTPEHVATTPSLARLIRERGTHALLLVYAMQHLGIHGEF